MAIAAYAQPGVRPVRADAAHQAADQAADVAARLRLGRRLAGAQRHRDGPRRRRVANVDRQEAALVVAGVERGRVPFLADTGVPSLCSTRCFYSKCDTVVAGQGECAGWAANTSAGVR